MRFKAEDNSRTGLNIFKRRLPAGLALLCTLLCAGSLLFGQTRKSGDIKKEKQRTEREIADTKKKISDNEKQTRTRVDEINSISSQIQRQQINIERINTMLETLKRRTEDLNDSIEFISRGDSILSEQLAKGLRQRHAYMSRVTPLSFISSAKTVNEILKRINYLKSLQRAQNKKVSDLRQLRERLSKRRNELDSVETLYAASLKELSTARTILDSRKQEHQQAVTELKKEGATLNRVLTEKQKRIRQLDQELDRIIAAEQLKRKEAQKQSAPAKKQDTKPVQPSKPQTPPSKQQPAKPQENKQQARSNNIQGQAEQDRKLTGSFVQNKGKLLFPVAGKYTITGAFGRSQYGDLSNVQMDNSGIDISVAQGTKARSVFDGEVTSIFFMPGYSNVVIVRHGEYLTVYAGLQTLSIRKGEKVKTGQSIGTIATVDGSTSLHFEVRKERDKLNPLQWVK